VFGILFLLFITIPIAELYLLIKVGGEIGFWNTFGLVLLTGFTGALLAKSQGQRVVMDIQKSLSKGEEPSDLMIGGVLILLGGILLLTPGFITDLIGLTLIFPLTRFFYVKAVKAHFKKAIANGNVKFYSNVSGSGVWPPNSRPQSATKVTQVEERNGITIVDVEAERIDK
jgi:UPF0716 protein FxsA